MSAPGKAPLVLQEPNPVGGNLPLGTTENGELVHYSLAGCHRGHHGLVIGDTGSGVSNALTVLAMQARAAATPVSTIYVDVRAGYNTALSEEASVSISGPDVAEASIEVLESVAEARMAMLIDSGADTYASLNLPTLFVVIKNSRSAFYGHAGRWVTLIQQARTLGIRVLAGSCGFQATHFEDISRDRHISGLREELSSQVVVLRHNSLTTDYLLSNSVIGYKRPSHLEPGQAQYLAAGEATEFTPYHLSYAPDSTAVLGARQSWLRKYPDSPLDPRTRDAIDHALDQRKTA